jgi:transcriptional regulator with XRE-family HTH domain
MLRFNPGALQAARLLRRRSQEWLGVTAGVGSGMIGKWERGENEPLASAVARMARVLDQPMEFFFTDEPAPERVEAPVQSPPSRRRRYAHSRRSPRR